MRVSIKENVLTVVTDILKATADKGIANLTATDEKGNQMYKVCMSTGSPSIEEFGIVCNSVVDGKLAVVIVEKMETTEAEIKKKYGKALVKGSKYLAAIAAQAQQEEAAIDAIFETAQSDEQPTTARTGR